jgi:hypothetical protein
MGTSHFRAKLVVQFMIENQEFKNKVANKIVYLCSIIPQK